MTKIQQRLLVAATLATVLAAPVASQAAVDLTVKIAPPAPRVEVVPAPRVGYTWAPGHWEWRTNRHVWIGGTWIQNRPGYVYQRPVWVQRNGGWVYTPGGYLRHDADRDGVPNRYDHDRDNDGIRNGPDNHPNNPVRR